VPRDPRGSSFSTKWKWDEAGEHLAKAARLKPNDPEIQISLAEREAALGRIAQALQILDGAARQFPNSLNLGAVRAQFLYYGRDYQGAIREGDRLTAMNLSGGLEWKSNALFQIGRHAEAVYSLHGFLGSWSSASHEVIANRKNAGSLAMKRAALRAFLATC
jgi:tetratricopeptide (TPR) repeat protein